MEFSDFPQGSPRSIFSVEEWVSGMWRSPTGNYFLCDVLGGCYENLTGSFARTQAVSAQLYKIWGVDNHSVFAVGSKGSCIHYDGANWTDFSTGLTGYLHAIGCHGDTIVCAGDSGFIARRVGPVWEQVVVPTNADIRCLHVSTNGEIYFGALDGECFRIFQDEFESINAPSYDFFSITEWNNGIYYGSIMGGVFRLSGNQLEPFKPNARGADIKPGGDYLWTCGKDQCARFDGAGWQARNFT
jgi:hypothetical protein